MKRNPDSLERIRILGSGGEADIFEVFNRNDGHSYALRRLRAPAEITSQRTGAESIELVRHPGLLQAVGRRRSDDGYLEELIPIIQCSDIQSTVKSGGVKTSLSLLIQATAALNAIHTAGFVHRDLKPSNIFVESTGLRDAWNSHRLVLTDLGMAIPHNEAVATNGITGSLGYMAPELLSGTPHSTKSDLFSLGVWFYWVVSGKHLLLSEAASDSLKRTQEYRYDWSILELPVEYSSTYWKNLFELLVDHDPEMRTDSAALLLSSLLEFAREEFSQTDGLLDLIWNPLALLQSDHAAIASAVFGSKSKDEPNTSILRLSYPTASREASLIVQCIREWWSADTLLISAESDPHQVIQRLGQKPPELVIVDATIASLDRSQSGLLAIMQNVALQENPCRVLILESGDVGSPGIATQTQSLTHSRIELVESEPPSEIAIRTWLCALLSCLPVHEAVLAELMEMGISSSAQIHQFVEMVVRLDAIRVEGGVLVWDRARLPLVRAASKGSAVVSRADVSPHANALGDLIETIPGGIPRGLFSLANEHVPGFARSCRELARCGWILTDAETGATRACVGPRVLATRESGSHGLIQELAMALFRLCADESIECPSSSKIALCLRVGDSADKLGIIALIQAKQMVTVGNARDALSLLEALRRSDSIQRLQRVSGLMWSLRGRALAQLGEFDLTAAAWESARIAFRSLRKPLSAARAAFERENHQLTLHSGFTLAAQSEIADLEDHRARELALFFEAEELNVMGYERGFRTCTAGMEALLGNPWANDRVCASVKSGLARAAVETGELAVARDRGATALRHARASGDRTLIGRVLAFLAGLEHAVGNSVERDKYGSEREALLSDARWIQRFASRTLQAGGAYERGRITQCIALELENVSESILAGHKRLERTSRRNLALGYLQADRLGQSVELINALEGSMLGEPELERSSVWRADLDGLWCEFFLEVGLFEQALSLCRRSTDSGMGSVNLKSSVLTRFEALALAFLGDRTQSKISFDKALHGFEGVGAIDEVIETSLFMFQIFSAGGGLETDLEALKSLELDAEVRGLGRLAKFARLVAIQVGSELKTRGRLEAARLLRVEAFEIGLNRIGLEAAYQELQGYIDVGDVAQARQCHREALERLRKIASGLMDYPAYRDAYFRDPRRQRFLEAGRRIAELR